MRMLVAVLCLGVLVIPAHADELYPNAVAPLAPEAGAAAPQLGQAEEYGVGPATEYVAPSADVPLYVPLTDEQQELPMLAEDPGVDYVPGMEAPATAPAKKAIADQVPAP